MTVSDSTKPAEGLGCSFKNWGKISAKAGKKFTTNALKNPASYLQIGANVATASAIRNPEAALSTLPEVITFITPERDFTWANLLNFISSKWNKNQKTMTICTIWK